MYVYFKKMQASKQQNNLWIFTHYMFSQSFSKHKQGIMLQNDMPYWYHFNAGTAYCVGPYRMH